MPIRNRELVRRFVEEVINGGDTGPLAELLTPDHVRHAPGGDLYGAEGSASTSPSGGRVSPICVSSSRT